MSLIFTASGDTQSAQHSSRIIEPVLRWLFPHLAGDAIERIVFLVRKCAHVTEYAVLALLVWRALRRPMRGDPRPWRWSHAGIALLGTALYASSDEIHQLFVPSREGRLADVLIDAGGAALGLVALWLFGKWRKLW
jgi:VanZ family protein